MVLQILQNLRDLGHEIDSLARIYNLGLREYEFGSDLSVTIKNALQ